MLRINKSEMKRLDSIASFLDDLILIEYRVFVFSDKKIVAKNSDPVGPMV